MLFVPVDFIRHDNKSGLSGYVMLRIWVVGLKSKSYSIVALDCIVLCATELGSNWVLYSNPYTVID